MPWPIEVVWLVDHQFMGETVGRRQDEIAIGYQCFVTEDRGFRSDDDFGARSLFRLVSGTTLSGQDFLPLVGSLEAILG